MKDVKTPDDLERFVPDDDSFFLLYKSVPAYVCSILIRDYSFILPDAEKSFCKNVILKEALFTLYPNYNYQMSDGTQPSISVLPNLLDIFPEEKDTIKNILLITLLKDFPLGPAHANENFSYFSASSIQKLWDKQFDDAQSLLFGYLTLKPRYDDIAARIRMENIKKRNSNYERIDLVKEFSIQNNKILQDIIENRIVIPTLNEINKLDLPSLNTAFKLIPPRTENLDHKKILNAIISSFANNILSNERTRKYDFAVKHNFIKTYAYFLLNSKEDEIEYYLKPFIAKFKPLEAISDLFKQFILSEDILNTYDKFWVIWNLFKEKVLEICVNGDSNYNVAIIVKGYLFARISWKETAKEWHSLKNENKIFVKEISEKLGHCPSAIYAISKLLNGIGSPYLDDGIFWISNMINSNKKPLNIELDMNTIYYIENCSRKYIYNYREKIRKTKAIKDNILIILNFLIDKGSAIGYMLRENIL